MNDAPNVIAFSYAKRALVPGTRENERMRAYGSVLHRHEIIVFTLAKEGFPAFQESGNVRLYATNARTRVGMVWRAYQIARSILRNNASLRFVVSAQEPIKSGLLAWFTTCVSLNAQLHIQMHGDMFSPYFYAGSSVAALKRSVATFVLQRAEKIRVVSKRIATSLVARGIPAEKITIVPIQADLEPFLSIYHERVYVDHTPVQFLYVGRLAPEKNLTLLLNAFADLKTEADIHLTLVGDGPCKQVLREQAARLGITEQLSWLPWTDQVAEIMKQADVFCLSSLHEGFGMVLIEAMATGLPVVTTDVGCAGEIITDHKEGRVVPVDDVPAYTSALKAMLEVATRTRFGHAGHATALATIPQGDEYLAAIKSSYTI